MDLHADTSFVAASATTGHAYYTTRTHQTQYAQYTHVPPPDQFINFEGLQPIGMGGTILRHTPRVRAQTSEINTRNSPEDARNSQQKGGGGARKQAHSGI